ncbi:hypothetical protein [Pedobacter metabolipauper]|uniref:YcxB-like protein n=1 Tax=Pedobacter metabolipauper TaxID=425513 RepID=A0A4R6SY75_9SPHI|nr:hypothetical protein [Pedobacter metabolipauper]TDQ10997.1 hypothetical protein ATK78_0109 [Pedobacter metabolipauper]
MKLEVTLNEEDLLNQSLFAASKSEQLKKKRRESLVFVFGCFVVISVLSTFKKDSSMPWWGFILIGLGFVGLYALYQPSLYKRHYRKTIAEIYKNRIGKVDQIEFGNNKMFHQDYIGESTVGLEHLEHVYEIGAYFFLRFKTDETVVLPKAQIPVEDFRIVLNQIINKYQLPFTQELDWKFK